MNNTHKERLRLDRLAKALPYTQKRMLIHWGRDVIGYKQASLSALVSKGLMRKTKGNNYQLTSTAILVRRRIRKEWNI